MDLSKLKIICCKAISSLASKKVVGWRLATLIGWSLPGCRLGHLQENFIKKAAPNFLISICICICPNCKHGFVQIVKWICPNYQLYFGWSLLGCLLGHLQENFKEAALNFLIIIKLDLAAASEIQYKYESIFVSKKQISSGKCKRR